jgi:hypothetical protein
MSEIKSLVLKIATTSIAMFVVTAVMLIPLA